MRHRQNTTNCHHEQTRSGHFKSGHMEASTGTEAEPSGHTT